VSLRNQLQHRVLLAIVEQEVNQITLELTAMRDTRRAELAEVSVNYRTIPMSNELKLTAVIAMPMALALTVIFTKASSSAGLNLQTIVAAGTVNLIQGAMLLTMITTMSHHSHVGRWPRWYHYHWATGLYGILGMAVGLVSDPSCWATLFLLVVALLGSGLVSWLLHRQALLHFLHDAYPVRAERAAAADAELAAWENAGRAEHVERRQARAGELSGEGSQRGPERAVETGSPGSGVQSLCNAGGQHG